MMPGIILSFVFNEQGGLEFRTSPLQDQPASTKELVDDAPYWFAIQISSTNPPGSTRSDLFMLQQACFHQPCDRFATHSTYSGSFVKADSVRIRQGSSLPGYRMVTPRSSNAGLIPSLVLASRISEPIQHRGDLVIAVSNRHPADDIQCVNRRRAISR